MHSRIAGRVESRGAIVDVQLRLRQDELERRRMDGRIAVSPYRVKAIIDTGAQRSCIAARVAADMLLEPIAHEWLHTASAKFLNPVYYLDVQPGWNLDSPPSPIPLRLHALSEVLGAEMLVGLDVLRDGEFVMHGPDRRFELLLPPAAR